MVASIDDGAAAEEPAGAHDVAVENIAAMTAGSAATRAQRDRGRFETNDIGPSDPLVGLVNCKPRTVPFNTVAQGAARPTSSVTAQLPRDSPALLPSTVCAAP